jgi:hypothetical protein
MIDGLLSPPRHPWTIKLIEEGMGCRLQYLNKLHELEALQANVSDVSGGYERHDFVQFNIQESIDLTRKIFQICNVVYVYMGRALFLTSP